VICLKILEENHITSLSEFAPLQPICPSDLHIVRSTGQSSKVGLAHLFVKVFKIQVTSSILPPSKFQVIDAHHFPDEMIIWQHLKTL